MSYESAFLYQVLTDFALKSQLPEDSAVCCRLRKLPKDDRTDRRPGEFVAAFGLFLVGVKLRDDVQDSNRWFNHLLWRMYRRRIKVAEERLKDLSPGLVSRLWSYIERHTELEQQHSLPSLHQLIVPTGDGFFDVFRSAAELASQTTIAAYDVSVSHRVAAIGRHIGQAIIAWDCAVDYDLDRLRGHFTPLTSQIDVRAAFDLCQQELREAARLCPSGAASQMVLHDVQQMVAKRRDRPAGSSQASILERWGMLRQRGYAYARCDPFCCFCEAADIAACCLTGGCEGCIDRNGCPPSKNTEHKNSQRPAAQPLNDNDEQQE